MKNLRNITKIAATLASVLVVASCAKTYEELAIDVSADDPAVAAPTTQTMTIRAGRPGAGGNTRTALDPTDPKNLKVDWQETNELGVYVDAVESKAGDHVKTPNSKFSIPTGGLDTTTDIATFTGNALPTSGVPEVVNYYAYYPYSDASSVGTDPTIIALALPATQTPIATSFDPAADFLFGSARTTGVAVGKAQDGSDGILFDFVRPFAVGKFEFSGESSVGTAGNLSTSIVKTVKMTFAGEEDVALDIAGNFTANLRYQTTTFNSTTADNVITLDYTGVNIKLSDLTAYWVMAPATVSEIELEIVAGDYTITKTISPYGSLYFEANHLNHGTVNLSKDATATQINLLATDSEGKGIYIPDDAFRTWVTNNISASDGGLTPSEAAKEVSINLGYSASSPGEIASLKGIEYFTGLGNLGVSNNQLTSLDVSANTNLKTLSCSNNPLTSPLDVSNNSELTGLTCDECSLSELDVTKNTKLTKLVCNDNSISTLDLSNNTELSQLTCDHNQLSSLVLSANTKLARLYCGYNQLSLLDLSANTELVNLQCQSQELTSLNLTNNTKLTSLFCNHNELTSFILPNTTTLATLSCGFNNLTSLDISKNSGLTKLDCDYNPGDSVSTFPVKAWFGNDAIPNNFTTTSWTENKITISINYYIE
jgi:transcription elongation factor Elf1